MKVKSLLKEMAAKGVWRALYERGHWFRESHWERRLGIHTFEYMDSKELGLTNPECHRYSASEYGEFHRAMKRVALRPGADVFIDYGAGLGRVVVLAAMYPFRKVIGVEVVPKLVAEARRNVEQARPFLVCRDVELVECDAARFRLPAEVTVLYFYNPFGGAILKAVMDDIERSQNEHPRAMTAIVKNVTEDFSHWFDQSPQWGKICEFKCFWGYRLAIYQRAGRQVPS